MNGILLISKVEILDLNHNSSFDFLSTLIITLLKLVLICHVRDAFLYKKCYMHMWLVICWSCYINLQHFFLMSVFVTKELSPFLVLNHTFWVFFLYELNTVHLTFIVYVQYFYEKYVAYSDTITLHKSHSLRIRLKTD